MRISDWSSDVCSSDLKVGRFIFQILVPFLRAVDRGGAAAENARATGLDLLQAERHGRGPRLIKGYRSHIYPLGSTARIGTIGPAELGKGTTGRVVRCQTGTPTAARPTAPCIGPPPPPRHTTAAAREDRVRG